MSSLALRQLVSRVCKKWMKMKLKNDQASDLKIIIQLAVTDNALPVYTGPYLVYITLGH